MRFLQPLYLALLLIGNGFGQVAVISEGEREIVAAIRQRILDAGVPDAAEMDDYRSEIPETGIAYEMVAIPGGEFLMGSPMTEFGRKEDEGPQHRVRISPFWMGRYEITWEQYEPFMLVQDPRAKDGSRLSKSDIHTLADAVSGPTTPYMEMDFGMGRGPGKPAINMTHHAASKFCQWLSAQTGHYYRLPTEAEWEYACRAGSSSAYHFGNDPADLPDYGIFDPDLNGSLFQYADIGTGRPNAWGLYDMHGNLIEWCLDQYRLETYRERVARIGEAGIAVDPVVLPTTRYPRVARGGSWYDPASDCRSASRGQSARSWQAQDAQLPKSLWYTTDAFWLGFRIVRPLDLPDTAAMHDFWNSGEVDPR